MRARVYLWVFYCFNCTFNFCRYMQKQNFVVVFVGVFVVFVVFVAVSLLLLLLLLSD